MSERRIVIAAFAATLLVGLGFLLVQSLTRKSDTLQTLGVQPVYPVAPIAAGEEVCQRGIGVADTLRRVRFNIGTFGMTGPPLTVTVRSVGGGALGSATVAPGWVDDGTPQEVAVGSIEPDRIVSVCIRNGGPVRAYVYGNLYTGNIRKAVIGVTPTVTPSDAAVDGVPIPGDLSMAFVSEKPRSILSRIPAAFRHASTFRPGFVGPWLYWLLLVLALVAAPIGLLAALRWASTPAGEPAGAPRDTPERRPPGTRGRRRSSAAARARDAAR